jgi:pimeloyl-ACP methyl ester carboxylesterase
MIRKIGLLIIMATLFGFNLIRFVERQRTRKLDRSDIHYTRFTNQQGDHSVYARIKGKPKLVLIHGFGASALLQWYDVARIMKNDYDVIALDLLCSGSSTVANNDYSVEAQVEHIRYTLEQLGVSEKIILCGNSYGGLVSAHFANTYPEKVEHLVIYDAPAKFYSFNYADSVAKDLGLAGLDQLLMPPGPEEMKTSLKVIYHEVPYLPDFLINAMFEEPILDQRKEQKKLLDDLIAKEKFYQDVDYNLPMKVSMIWGEYDRLIPMSTATQLKQLLHVPDDRFVVIPNTAHAANMEVPKEFCKVLNDLITKNP